MQIEHPSFYEHNSSRTNIIIYCLVDRLTITLFYDFERKYLISLLPNNPFCCKNPEKMELTTLSDRRNCQLSVFCPFPTMLLPT